MPSYYRTPYNRAINSTNTATQYGNIHNGVVAWQATQSLAQKKWPQAGYWENLRIYLSANAAAATATLSLQIGGSDTAMTVAIGAGTTGWFEDTTSQIAGAYDDLVNLAITRSEAGSITVKAVAVDFLCETAGTVTGGGASGVTMSLGTASVTRYQAGNFPLGIQSTEADTSTNTYVACAATSKKMKVNVTSNARTTTSTFTSRINGADGNQTIAVGSGLTGWFEDSSNTDSLSAGDYFNTKLVTGTGTGNIIFIVPYYLLESTGTNVNVFAYDTGNLATNQTRYTCMSGGATWETTEANANLKFRGTGTIKDTVLSVPTNSSDQNSTITVRKNAADTTITFTVTASTTGRFSDTAHDVTYADGDLICLKAVRAAGGTGNMTPVHACFELVADAETITGGATGSPYYAYRYMQSMGAF